MIRFDKNRSSPAPYYANLGRVIDITRPSGAKLTFAYDSINYCTHTKTLSSGDICTAQSTAYRIATVRNSYGYRLSFNYAALDPSYDPSDPTSQFDMPTWSTILSGAVKPNAPLVRG